MSTKHLIHTVPTIFVKGAIDVLLKRCVNIRFGDEIRPMTEEDRKEILAQNNYFQKMVCVFWLLLIKKVMKSFLLKQKMA